MRYSVVSLFIANWYSTLSAPEKIGQFVVNLLRKRGLCGQRLTCSPLTVNGVADDLVWVVLGFLPGKQGGCAGVRRSGHVLRSAGQTFSHDDRQLGSGTCGSQSIVSYALVITRVFQCQLVDEQDPGALALEPPEWLDGLAVLEPVQDWGRLTCAVAHKSGCVAAGQRRRLGGLHNQRRCCFKWDTKVSSWASTMMFIK